MVVELKKDIEDYLGRFKIRKGTRYIVYAIDSNSGKAEYYIMTKDSDANRLYEPLPYPSDLFTTIDNTIPEDWGYFEDKDIKAKIRSFPEWLNRDFALKAHDFDMGETEFGIIRKYKDLYEKMWIKYLKQ